MRAYRESLWFRLSIAAASLVALCFVTLAVLINTTTRKEFAAQFAVQQQSAAEILADGVNRDFEERMHALELAASTLSGTQRFDGASVQKFLEARPVLQSMFNGGLFVTGTDGVAVASLPASLGRVGVSYAERPFVRAALAGRSAFGEPVIGKKLGRAIIVLSTPVQARGTGIQGALMGVIDLGEPGFLDRIAKSRYGSTGGYVLVAPASRMIVTATDARLVMTPVAKHPTVDRWVAGEDGTGELVTTLGMHLVASVKHLPVNGWYVAASMPVDEAYAPMASLQKDVLLIAAVLLLVALASGAWALHRELAPLGRAARVLAAHRSSGMPVRELPVGRNDEIGVLIRGFNDLLGRLSEKEAILEASRLRLSALVQSLHVGVAVLDARAGVMHSNPMADTWLPKINSTAALLDEGGAPLGPASHPVTRALQTGLPALDVVIGVPAGPDADAAWLLVSVVPQCLATGEVREVVVTLQDISQQMRVRRALQQSGEHLRSLLHASPVAAFLCDEDGRFTFVNRAFQESFGYTLEDLGDINRWRELALSPHDGSAQALARWTAPARSNPASAPPAPFAGVELSIRCKDGTQRAGLATHATLMNGNRLEQFVAIADITSQVQVKNALLQSTADKDALLREVHHRVKNNLQVITSLLRLESRRSDLPQLHAAFEDMQGRIRSMAVLHEMLYREGVFASVDLGQYLRQTATQVFRSQAAASGAVQLRTELEAIEVGLDQATPCGLMVNELISNCLKHAFPRGRGGQVDLSLRRNAESGLVVLSVADDGVGLPADFAHRRAQSLGMQLTDDLARQMGGQLAISNSGGTRFEVQFELQSHA